MRRAAAGFAAGITEALVIVTPFEVVKIRLQQQKGLAYNQLKYHVSGLATGVYSGHVESVMHTICYREKMLHMDTFTILNSTLHTSLKLDKLANWHLSPGQA